jgi:chromosome segregation ATPase
MIDMQPIDPSITTESLTQAKVEGNGTFDTLMRAFKGHIDEEFQKNHLRGPEYSQVYLGGLQAVMQTALQLTLQQRSVTLDNELKQEQIVLAKIQQREEEAKILQIEAQTRLIEQQRTNLQDELLTSAKQREKLDQEIINLGSQKLLIDQQRANLVDELLTNALQRDKISQEIINLAAQLPLIQAQISEMNNRVTLVAAQIRKIDAEILSEQATRDRIAQEILLMQAKVQTEKAQTQDNMVGGQSVLGKQIALYQAQADGFKRDAEQKAAQILVDSWKIRRTTDEGTVADSQNRLDDFHVGQSVAAMMIGIGITQV